MTADTTTKRVREIDHLAYRSLQLLAKQALKEPFPIQCMFLDSIVLHYFYFSCGEGRCCD
eukprot:SAG31_NODE_2379_length_5836_cov_4.527453_6_plen_60_part_00